MYVMCTRQPIITRLYPDLRNFAALLNPEVLNFTAAMLIGGVLAAFPRKYSDFSYTLCYNDFSSTDSVKANSSNKKSKN